MITQANLMNYNLQTNSYFRNFLRKLFLQICLNVATAKVTAFTLIELYFPIWPDWLCHFH